jgi:hypothetical protein
MLPQDRSFRTFINNMFLALTFADNRFVKTVWVVISKPGFLSREFSEGRRVKYLRPLSMFFFLNLIYFLFPLIQLFNASLRTQLNSVHGKLALQAVSQKMVQLGIKDVYAFSLIYEQIRPTLGAEAEERMRRLRERPIRFDRIITPRFDCSPGQDIRSLLAASPSIKELLETGGPLR